MSICIRDGVTYSRHQNRLGKNHLGQDAQVCAACGHVKGARVDLKVEVKTEVTSDGTPGTPSSDPATEIEQFENEGGAGI